MTHDPALILVVDDEPANLALLRKLVQHQGYDVLEATDGRTALELVAARRPDLVCLDIMMPGMDGIEVCRRLRAVPEHASLPILLVTALTRPEDKARGLEAGANDFLSKPFDESELFARIHSLLRTKALQDRLAALLERYVSRSVAAEVLRDPFAVSLGGSRRRVTTVFADIRGFTALAEEQPPEVVLDVLNRYITVAGDAVDKHGGTVADLLGDGIFAFFGAPVQHDDDAQRAVRAALDIRSRVTEIVVPSLPAMRMQTGIGITTGEVIAGNVGSEQRMHYAVVGDSVNVASRLQSSAGPGQVLVDAATFREVCQDVVSQDLGTLRLAGKGDWVHTYAVISLR